MKTMFDDLSVTNGSNSVKVRGKSNKGGRYYRSVQGVSQAGCTCKYHYEGTWKHPLIKLPDPLCKVLSDSDAWLHDDRLFEIDANGKYRFNESVANIDGRHERASSACFEVVGSHHTKPLKTHKT